MAAPTPQKVYEQTNLKLRGLSPSADQTKFNNDLKIVQDLFDQLKGFGDDAINKEKKKDEILLFINEGFDKKLSEAKEARILHQFNQEKKAIDSALNSVKSASTVAGDKSKTILEAVLPKIDALVNNSNYQERDYGVEYIKKVQEEAEKWKLFVLVKAEKETKLPDGKDYVNHMKAFQSELKKGVPAAFPANDKYLTTLENIYKSLSTFAENFRAKFADNPEAASTIQEIDTAFKTYEENVLPQKNKVAVQKHRAAKRSDGSLLEYNIEWHLRKLTDELNKGVPPNRLHVDAYMSTVKIQRDNIQKWFDDFMSKYGELEEAAQTIQEVEALLELYKTKIEANKGKFVVEKFKTARMAEGSTLEYGFDQAISEVEKLMQNQPKQEHALPDWGFKVQGVKSSLEKWLKLFKEHCGSEEEAPSIIQQAEAAIEECESNSTAKEAIIQRWSSSVIQIDYLNQLNIKSVDDEDSNIFLSGAWTRETVFAMLRKRISLFKKECGKWKESQAVIQKVEDALKEYTKKYFGPSKLNEMNDFLNDTDFLPAGGLNDTLAFIKSELEKGSTSSDTALVQRYVALESWFHEFRRKFSYLEGSEEIEKQVEAVISEYEAKCGKHAGFPKAFGVVAPYPDMNLPIIIVFVHDIPDKVRDLIKEYNVVAIQINRKYEDLVSNLLGSPFYDPTSQRSNSSNYNINDDDVGKLLIKFIPKEVKALEPYVDTCEQAKIIVTAAKDFQAKFKECQKDWERIRKMAKSYNEVRVKLADIKRSNKSTYKSCFASTPGESITKELVKNMEQCDSLLQDVEKYKNEFTEFPEYREVLQDIRTTRDTAIRYHTSAMAHIASVIEISKKAPFVKALERFPSAYEYMRSRLLAGELSHHWRRPYGDPIDTDKLFAVAPELSSPPSNAVDYDMDFIKIIPIQPGNTQQTGLPVKSSDSKVSAGDHGKVLFSTAAIDRVVSEREKLASSFKAGEEIYARLFWDNKLKNYPIGKHPKTGEPFYGPEEPKQKFSIEFMVELKINGSSIKRRWTPNNCFTHKQIGSDSAKLMDKFWSDEQSIELCLFSSKGVSEFGPDFGYASQRFSRELTKLPNGNHKVEVNLTYRVIPDYHFFQDADAVWPYEVATSHVISTGSFDINISAPHKMVNPLSPKTNTADEKVISDALAKWCADRDPKPEQVFYATVKSDWKESSWESFVVGESQTYIGSASFTTVNSQQECVGYGKEVHCFSYRNPTKGWLIEQVAAIQCVVTGPIQRHPKKSYDGGIGRIMVDVVYSMDADLLPDEMLADIKRCSEAQRNI